MEVGAKLAERPDVPTEERAAHELIMHILKLRWMGFDSEAREVEVVLRQVDPACTLLAGPFDTD